MGVKGSAFYDLNEILSKVDQNELFKYYTDGIPPNTLTSSPLRKDKNPSFIYGITDNEFVFYKDFSTGETGNIIHFLERKYNCAFKEVLEIIYKDFHVVERKNIIKTKYEKDKRETFNIQIRTCKWSNFYLQYWYEYGISKATLNYFEVHPITHFWMKGNRFICPHSYAYKLGIKKYKILNLKGTIKWISNCTSEDYQGHKQLNKSGSVLIITKGLKDIMVLHELGINSIAPQAENIKIQNSSYIKHIIKNFKKVFILYDNDDAGIKNSSIISKELALKPIYIPLESGCKDISDYAKKFGIVEAQNLIYNLING